MIKSVIRKPDWQITILRPDFEADSISYKKTKDWSKSGRSVSNVSFGSSADYAQGDSAYSDLISYSYSNSIADPSGQFSLILKPNMDSRGRTWKEKIKPMDMIRIREFGVLRYVGFVKSNKYTFTMPSTAKPERNIEITGVSFGGLIQQYILTLDIYQWFKQGNTAQGINDELAQILSSKAVETQELQTVLSEISNKFFQVVFGSQRLKGFFLWVNELVKFSAASIKSSYPRLFQVFQVENNNLWDIYRQILTYPIYEIFGNWDNTEEVYRIICRETPFDYQDWKELKLNTIDAKHLISHNFTESCDQIYTHYFSNMANAGFTDREDYAREDLDQVSVFDLPKMYIYGYKKMQASFSFFDSGEAETRDFSSKEFLQDNAIRMYGWFKNNLEMQNGEITIMTVPDSDKSLPDIGERAKFLGGEFYIEGYNRSATYPGAMKTTLKLTRGYRYGRTTLEKDGTIQKDSSGSVIITPQLGPIRNISDKLNVTEKEGLRG